MASLSTPAIVHPDIKTSFLKVLPAVVLLAAIGYLGKRTEQGLA